MHGFALVGAQNSMESETGRRTEEILDDGNVLSKP